MSNFGLIVRPSEVIHVQASRVRDEFPFAVEKRELYDGNGFRSGLYGLYRDDTNEQISSSSVSAKYCPHSVDDIAVLTEAAMSIMGESAVLKMHWHNGHYVTVAPSKADRLVIYDNHASGNTPDNIFPVMGISGGYDGKGFEGSLLYKRDMCRNLSIMKTVSGTSMRIRHTKNMQRRMAELQDVFGKLSEQWGNVATTALRLESENVPLITFLHAMYPQKEETSKAGDTRHQSRTADIVRRIIHEADQSGRSKSGLYLPEPQVTAWQALQGLQGYLQHETLASKRQKSELGKAFQAMDGTTATLLRNAESYLLSAIG